MQWSVDSKHLLNALYFDRLTMDIVAIIIFNQS